VDNTLLGPDRTEELIRECQTEAGDVYRPAVTAESAVEAYERWLAWHDCLVSAGFALPAPPSEELFVDDMLRQGWGSFDSVWVAFEGVEFDELGYIFAICPHPEADLG